MLFHSFKYSFKVLLRDRGRIFWCAAFPILLATLFQFAFGGLSSSEAFKAIPVAVVMDSDKNNTELMNTLDTLSEEGSNQLLVITYTTEEKALELLDSKDVDGILYDEGALRLVVSGGSSNQKLNQSILTTFVGQYNASTSALNDIAAHHPEKMGAALSMLSVETSYLKEDSFTDGNYSESLTYFFNLIAMTCLYASFIGSAAAIYNQANLSPLAARKAISPVPKLISVLGSVIAAFITAYGCLLLSLLYMGLVLKIDFGSQLSYVLLTSLIGTLAGTSIGFFVGSVGHSGQDVKFGILISISMLCSMLSGLMFGQIQILVDQVCPILNKINPAALISNSFYSLVICPSHERFFQNIIILSVETVIFIFAGVLSVRRKKYASL